MVEQSEEGRPRQRGASVVGPLILITLGVILLLNTLDVLPWGVWQTLWRLWPLALILVGVELLLGRGNPWLSTLIAVLVLGVAVTLAVVSPLADGRWTLPGAGGWTDQAIVVPLEGAREASLNVRFGAGRLQVDALGREAANLVEGDLRHYRGEDGMVPRVQRQADRAEITLQGREGGTVVIPGDRGGERWSLLLNPDVPFDLRVAGGAAEVDLNLSSLRVRDLSLDIGASSVRVQLPEAAGLTEARFKTGMADLSIEIPQGVAARINSRGGLSSFRIDEGRFPRQGDYYVSPNFETAQNRVAIDIDAGMANVTVR